NGDGRRITELTGGAFDPSWSPDGRSIAFAGFQASSFRIYRQEMPETGQQIALDPRARAVNGEALAWWEWTELEAPVVAQAGAQPYSTLDRMSLDFAAADALYAPGYAAAQGAQFLMSDMLGNHILFLGVSAFQASDLSQLVDSFSGNAMYLNLSHRLNYGVGVFRYKGLFRDVSWDIYEEAGSGADLIASYPLSRCRRIELPLGVQQGARVDVEDGFGAGPRGSATRDDPRDLTRTGLLATNYLSYIKDNTLLLPTG